MSAGLIVIAVFFLGFPLAVTGLVMLFDWLDRRYPVRTIGDNE